MSKEPLPPRQYAEQVLGKAVTEDQLDELFELHAAAHPIVTHGKEHVVTFGGSPLRRRTKVEILTINPKVAPSAVRIVAVGKAFCNEDEDQWNRRLGVTIAFARALERLRRDYVEERATLADPA